MSRRRRKPRQPRSKTASLDAMSPMDTVVHEVLADQPEAVDRESTGLSAKDRALQQLEAKEADIKARQQQRDAKADQGYVPKAIRKYVD